MDDRSLLFVNVRSAPPAGARCPFYARGNLETRGSAITVTIGGGAALVIAAIQPGGRCMRHCGRARIPAATRPVARALPAARYHPLGVEQEQAGLDELGRIPSKQKEKEALWLT